MSDQSANEPGHDYGNGDGKPVTFNPVGHVRFVVIRESTTPPKMREGRGAS